MSRRVSLASAMLLTAALVLPARAQPPQSAAKLRERAELIVVGRVESSRREDTDGKSGAVLRFVYLTVKVEAVQKGDAVKAGEELEVRCWATLKQPPGSGLDPGHSPIPGDGGRARFFLIRRNDQWRVIVPNGAELLDATPPQKLPIEVPAPSFPPSPPETARPPLLRWLPAAGVLVVIAVIAVRGLRQRRRRPPPGSP